MKENLFVVNCRMQTSPSVKFCYAHSHALKLLLSFSEALFPAHYQALFKAFFQVLSHTHKQTGTTKF